MNTIISGRFEQQSEADRALVALEAAGFQHERISTFFVNPAGMHDMPGTGQGTEQDPDASAGAHHAGTGAVVGATAGGGAGMIAGLVTAPFLGPGAALAGAAVGAYIGSLAGALEQTSHPAGKAQPGRAAEETPPRKSGMLVAVAAIDGADEDNAIGVLRANGALDVERTEGTIAGGDWTDFDPLRPPELVSAQRGTEQSAKLGAKLGG